MPGQLLEDENALSARFAVSRSVVRDAVKILVGKGLVQVRRGIGTRVRDRQDWGLLDNDVLAWSDDVAGQQSRLLDLLEMRKTIEPRAAALAARNGDDAAIGLIGAAIEDMKARCNTVDGFIIADARFHGAILRATHNEFFAALEGVIFSALLASIRVTNSNADQCAQAVPQHAAIYDAIVARDEKEAEARMLKVLSVTEQRLNKSLQKKNAHPQKEVGIRAHSCA